MKCPGLQQRVSAGTVQSYAYLEVSVIVSDLSMFRIAA